MQQKERAIRPGSRPGRNWCCWLDAIVTWSPDERAAAREKADRAYASRSIRAQYAAGELGALKQADQGTLVHRDRCVTRGCPHRADSE